MRNTICLDVTRGDESRKYYSMVLRNLAQNLD